MIGTALSLATLTGAVTSESSAQTFIGRQTPTLKSDLMTPEALWAMGRIGSVQANAAGTQAVYAVTYYSVAENKSHSVLYLLDLKTKQSQRLTTSTHSESGAVWIKVSNEEQIAYLRPKAGSNQLWVMKSDGSHRRQISHEADDVQDFLFSPDSKRVILVKEVAQHTAIAPKEEDLPKATGMVINDLMYKHWDQYVTSAPHPFLADFDGTKVTVDVDLLEGEPFESPMMPFGGNEQLAWSPDSRQIAYTCRKKVGRDYATSTDSDIFSTTSRRKLRATSANPKAGRHRARATTPAACRISPSTQRTAKMPTSAMIRIPCSRPMASTLRGAAWSATAMKATVRASASTNCAPARRPTSQKASTAA